MRIRPFAVALLAGSLVLGACGEKEKDPLDVRAVALQAETNFRQVAVELARALSFLQESQLFGGWVAGFCDDDAPLPTTPPGTGDDRSRRGDEGFDDDGSDDDDFFDDDCTPFDLEARTTALADVLSTRIFNEANVESNRDGVLVFRLRPDVTCAPRDNDCYETLTRYDLRLQVTSDAPGDLDIAVLVGPSRFQPLVFGLHVDDLTAEVDLAELKRSLEYFTRGSVGVNMSGKAQLGLARAQDGFTASVSILEAIAIRDVRGDDFHLEMAPAFPALSLQIDPANHEVRLVAGLGRMELRAPLSAFDDECGGYGRVDDDAPWGDDDGEDGGEDGGEDDGWDDCGESSQGTLGIRAAGFTGTLSLASRNGVDEIRVVGLGLGPEAAVVEFDGSQVLRVDLNEDMNRKVDVVARAEPSGVSLQFAPGLDLKLALNFIHLSRIFDVPSWMMDDTLRIRLDGAASPTIRLFFREAFSSDDDWAHIEEEDAVASLQVLAGRLLLESAQAGSLEVGEGMCLFDATEGAAGEGAGHPFDHLLVGECR